MKNKIKLLSYISITLNAILTIALIVFTIQMIKSGFNNSKIALWVTVFLFMFVFSIGIISLIIYRHTHIKGLLLNGILSIIPLPYLSIISIIYQILFIIKIDENMTENNNMKFNFQEKN